MLLNGVATGNVVGSFGSLTNFSINSGFVAGINNLDFQISDFGAPTAFRVDNLSGTADLGGAIPEPATWAMMIVGFAGMGAALRRRRGQTAPATA